MIIQLLLKNISNKKYRFGFVRLELIVLVPNITGFVLNLLLLEDKYMHICWAFMKIQMFYKNIIGSMPTKLYILFTSRIGMKNPSK
jgi:hypothetical protein